MSTGSDNLTGGVIDLVKIRAGDALQTLSSGLPPAIDLLLLDGAKALYPKVLDLLEGRLRPGAFVVADNADYSPESLARVRETPGYLSLPFADDVELSMRVANDGLRTLPTRPWSAGGCAAHPRSSSYLTWFWAIHSLRGIECCPG